MEEQRYLSLRKFFFWIFLSLFTVFTPMIVFYSLGYKLDVREKRFLKTGTISIKTFPENAQLLVNNSKEDKLTPCVLTELMPRIYDIVLEKEGFYPYQFYQEVKPSAVATIDVVLVPKIEGMQKVRFPYNTYKFFLSKRLLGEKIFLFTDQGIFLMEKDFKNVQRLSSFDIGLAAGQSLKGIIESNNRLLFWNADAVWMVNLSFFGQNPEVPVTVVYTAKDAIKNVFVGLKEQYLIVYDGEGVLASDINNSDAAFTVLSLREKDSEVFYDSGTETLYVRRMIPQGQSFSLFKVEFLPLLQEKVRNEKVF
ncbi:MAG: PEGA domain-containing protein [Candidatus Omnitrophica bacterium]|nr:PEGA domain-containing protein [Candidatus Omnitrophota bacterium]